MHDFEFIAQPGERPDVVCLAAHELRSRRTLRLWRDELGPRPPYHTDRRALFVNFVANADCPCHLALGWPLPARVLDLSPAFRHLTNGRLTPEGKGLLGALRYYGFSNTDQKHKDAMRDRILRGWPFTPMEQKTILDYCTGDVDDLLLVLPKIIADPEFDLGGALYHGEFAAVSALMQHHGVPIDMEIFPQLADDETWRAVRDAAVPAIDVQYGVYVRNAVGDWTFNTESFAAYLGRERIDGWPLTDNGKLDMKRRTFDEMAKAWPQLEGLRQLRHMRDKMRKIKLAIGRDGCNRTVLWPFKSKTSRTQPKAAEWIFSPAVWLRSLIKPGPGKAVAYIDWSNMEFLEAAVFSDGHCGPVNNMLDAYNTGDPYLAFAKRVGAVPSTATKHSHAAVRHKYKIMLLAVQYGMSAETLASRAGVSTFEAHQVLNQHREIFAQYWKWSDDWMQHALQTARHGIKLLACVHDALLIEAPIERIEAGVALTREIMRRASRIVLNVDAAGTHELRTDVEIVRYPDRYSDPRGAAFWDQVVELLDAHRGNKTDAAKTKKNAR